MAGNARERTMCTLKDEGKSRELTNKSTRRIKETKQIKTNIRGGKGLKVKYGARFFKAKLKRDFKIEL